MARSNGASMIRSLAECEPYGPDGCGVGLYVSGDFPMKLLGLLAVAVLAVGMSGEAKGEQVNGGLRIDDYVGSYSSTVRIRNLDASGISDGFDAGYDHNFLNPPSGTPGMYSNIQPYDSSVQQVSIDYRLPTTSHDTFDIEMMFGGSNSSTQTNYLLFTFPTTDIFGSEPITLQQTDSSGNPLGSSYDVREIIDGTLGGSLNPSAGRFNLPDLPVGASGVYAHYSITVDNSVPEPSTLTLLGIAAAVMAFGWWRRRRRIG